MMKNQLSKFVFLAWPWMSKQLHSKIAPRCFRQPRKVFPHIFYKKRCAALSSVVISEGPFGQNFGFDANVFISKIDPSIDTQIKTSIENEFHLQTLGYVTSKNKAAASKNDEKLVVKFCVFGMALDVKIATFQNCSPVLQTTSEGACQPGVLRWGPTLFQKNRIFLEALYFAVCRSQCFAFC